MLARLVLPDGYEGESVPYLSLTWWLAGNIWYSLACGHIIPVSAFIFTWCSLYMPVCPHMSPSIVSPGLILGVGVRNHSPQIDQLAETRTLDIELSNLFS